MYSDISKRISESSRRNSFSASVFASSVLPTPEPPMKTKLPAGLFDPLSPTLSLLTAAQTRSIASSCPNTTEDISSFSPMSLSFSSCESIPQGIPVRRDTTLQSVSAFSVGKLSALTAARYASRSILPEI